MWGEPQERHYHKLKHVIVSKHVLMLPNVNEEFILRTDASDVGLGATLLQHRDGQIFSQWLTLAENYWTEKEDIA